MKMILVVVFLLASSSLYAQSVSEIQRGYLENKDDANDHGYYSEKPNVSSIQRDLSDTDRHDVEDYSEAQDSRSIIEKNSRQRRDDAHDNSYDRFDPYGNDETDDSKDWP